nr:E275 [uncultured bacterium]
MFGGAVSPISNKQFLTNQFFMDILAVLCINLDPGYTPGKVPISR